MSFFAHQVFHICVLILIISIESLLTYCTYMSSAVVFLYYCLKVQNVLKIVVCS